MAEPPQVIPPNVGDTKDHLSVETCGGIRYAGSALRGLGLGVVGRLSRSVQSHRYIGGARGHSKKLHTAQTILFQAAESRRLSNGAREKLSQCNAKMSSKTTHQHVGWVGFINPAKRMTLPKALG